MAAPQLMKNNAINPSVSFHPRTYGQNIRIDDQGAKAIRHTSFDNGVTFTSKQIKMNERICMKIIDIDESGQWLGSLAIGFTNIDPNTIRTQDLCKSALPNLCQKNGTSYVKRIFERLTREIIITFYYNQDGAFYILDGREQELCRNIDVKNPLWGVVDIYGNVKGVVFTEPPEIIDGSRTFFTKYQKPDKLPIRYYNNLKPTDLQHIGFHDIHGPELELFCQNIVAFRRNVQRLSRPYLFINLPMTPGDEFYIRILSIDPNYRTPGIIGFTTARPSDYGNKIDNLPNGDPMALYDRPEFWILNEDAFDEKLSELDEYRFLFDKGGDFHMWRNNSSTPKTVAFADKNQTFYPFFFLNGRITALSLIGIISPTSVVQVNNSKKEEKDKDAGLCQICSDNPANCVMIPCGHVFFCSDCKDNFEKSYGKNCPLDRNPYEQVLEIANS